MTRKRHFGLVVLVAGVTIAACTSPSAGEGAASIGSVPSAEPPQAPSPPSVESSSEPPLAPLSADEAWAKLIMGDAGAVSYPSLAASARDADAIVIASPGKLVKGPDHKDEYGNVIHLATLKLNIERVIQGTIITRHPGMLTLQIWLGVGGPDGYDYSDHFERLVASRPSGRAILLLANAAVWNKKFGGPADHFMADPYFYQINGGQGYLRDVNGLIEPPRVSEEALATMAGTWQSDLRGGPFEAAVHALEALQPTP